MTGDQRGILQGGPATQLRGVAGTAALGTMSRKTGGAIGLRQLGVIPRVVIPRVVIPRVVIPRVGIPREALGSKKSKTS